MALILVRLLCLFFLLGSTLVAAPHHFGSALTRTHLLELYTSEGCSSCPPAEAWLGRLREEPGLWRDFVPVAFHVSYWDRLGWRDRFARSQFTERQYAYASAWRSDSVYTPAFVLDGREWRQRGGPPAASAEPAEKLTLDFTDNGQCVVDFSASGELDVTVALLGGGIESAVKAGENAGRTLPHDFVVLRLETAPLVAGKATLTLVSPSDAGVRRHALAAWVTRRGELTPLQAAGGWLD